jgi:hypothetical protein
MLFEIRIRINEFYQFRYYLIVFLLKDHFVVNEKSEKGLVKWWYSHTRNGVFWCFPTLSGEL